MISELWNQPIPPKLQTAIMSDERIICSFLGDWIDYGIGGKKRVGTWVVTNKNIHFVGKVGFWDAGSEIGEQIRLIPLTNIREVRLEGKKINIYFIKYPSRPDKISKRGMSIKKMKGESSAELIQRRNELVKRLQVLLTRQGI